MRLFHRQGRALARKQERMRSPVSAPSAPGSLVPWFPGSPSRYHDLARLGQKLLASLANAAFIRLEAHRAKAPKRGPTATDDRPDLGDLPPRQRSTFVCERDLFAQRAVLPKEPDSSAAGLMRDQKLHALKTVGLGVVAGSFEFVDGHLQPPDADAVSFMAICNLSIETQVPEVAFRFGPHDGSFGERSAVFQERSPPRQCGAKHSARLDHRCIRSDTGSKVSS